MITDNNLAVFLQLNLLKYLKMRNIIKGPKVTWVDIKDPTEKDIKYLKREFNLHPLVLGELIPPGQKNGLNGIFDCLFS